MAYPTVAIANAFISRAQNGLIPDLSPMKLQKLMFYAQSWHLKIYDEPLFDDFFAKWQYGPVIPSLYHEMKSYGASSINHLISTIDGNGWNPSNLNVQFVTPVVPANDFRTNQLIDKIISVYGSLRATQLSALTHMEGTAWSQTSDTSAVIDNETLKRCIK